LPRPARFNYAGSRRPRRMGEGRRNRLADEKSPYLLEHKDNPVDWWPWGKEALARAKNDGKPIFLSIGYSTCHWCHRMREESFEDEKTATFINKNFVPIKVDREERPEIDAYYMGAVQAMTGSGGWPLSVFLTPDLKPFYGGTYFPPEPRYGMPSFLQLLEFVSNLWKEKRGEVTANAEQVAKAIAEQRSRPSDLAKGAMDEGYEELVSSFDQVNGGFGSAPKFPLPVSLQFLLRYHFRMGKDLALTGALKTLDQMMGGGIRDHVGGGFHRYSTDRIWLVPHFEKMLYDNALLARVYAEAYQITKKEGYAEVVRETLGWLLTEMRAPGGGFFSAQDADTADGEGEYYSWTPEEVAEVLGGADGETFCRLYGITKTGNFEGRSLLHFTGSPSKEEGRMAARAKPLLYRERLKRARPATDEKILTSWNGLAISALAFSGAVLEDESYIDAARESAEFILGRVSKDGKLLRRFAGGEAAFTGTLEDYAFFVQGLLDLFEVTGETAWLKDSFRLVETMLHGYEDAEEGGFYMTTEPEPFRLKPDYDGPTPSGNAVAALDLARLAELTGDDLYRKKADLTLRSFGKDIMGRPASHACALIALDLLMNGGREIVVVAPTSKAAGEFRRVVFGEFVPDKAVISATAESFPALSKLSTLLQGRDPAPTTTAYVCQHFACKLPARTADELRAQLKSR
jgi:uncharacterized protein